MVDAVPLSEVVAEGDLRGSLEALRDRLAGLLDGLSDRQVVHAAPLAKQLTDTLQRLADLPEPDAEADTVESAQEVVERKLRAVQ